MDGLGLLTDDAPSAFHELGDVLEPALAARPGRELLLVEDTALPGAPERRRLLFDLDPSGTAHEGSTPPWSNGS